MKFVLLTAVSCLKCQYAAMARASTLHYMTAFAT